MRKRRRELATVRAKNGKSPDLDPLERLQAIVEAKRLRRQARNDGDSVLIDWLNHDLDGDHL